MKFKQELQEKLNLPLDELPGSYQQIGTICLIPETKHKKEIGRVILKIYPKFETVAVKHEISGEFRLPKIEIVAGKKETETLLQENQCTFKLDVSKVMFSKGNQEEKRRLVSQVRKDEVIVDMFAGIGYFSIPAAKLTNAKRVYAIELNPESYKFLEENVRINRLGDRVFPILGDCRKVRIKEKADRILMGYLPSAKPYLKTALAFAKKGAIIHYHTTAKSADEAKKDVKGLGEILHIQKVKKYAPSVFLFVVDLKI
jgi:tRNA wybutosine-synthesizing protein 2